MNMKLWAFFIKKKNYKKWNLIKWDRLKVGACITQTFLIVNSFKCQLCFVRFSIKWPQKTCFNKRIPFRTAQVVQIFLANILPPLTRRIELYSVIKFLSLHLKINHIHKNTNGKYTFGGTIQKQHEMDLFHAVCIILICHRSHFNGMQPISVRHRSLQMQSWANGSLFNGR